MQQPPQTETPTPLGWAVQSEVLPRQLSEEGDDGARLLRSSRSWRQLPLLWAGMALEQRIQRCAVVETPVPVAVLLSHLQLALLVGAPDSRAGDERDGIRFLLSGNAIAFLLAPQQAEASLT